MIRNKHFYFIVNAHSRTGKAGAIWHTLEERLQELQISYTAYITEYEGHAISLAKEISSIDEEVIHIVAMGGDGTVNEVVNGIQNFDKVILGYIPTGSGNDLARGLGVSKEPLENLERILQSDETMCMDIGRVTWGDKHTRLFTVSSGVGVDADVCDLTVKSKLKRILNKLGLGKLTYLILTLKALFAMQKVSAFVSFDDKETMAIERLIFVVAMNHPTEGGGVPMAPHASASDGKLTMCCIFDYTKPAALLQFPKLIQGKHEGIKGCRIVEFSKARIVLDIPKVLHTDGELNGNQTVIEFETLPGILKIMK